MIRSAIVPSARALVLLALLAPAAVVVAATAPSAWLVVPVAALALIAATLIDGLLAGRLHDLKLTCPSDTEVGQPARLVLHAEFGGRAGGAPQAAQELAHPIGQLASLEGGELGCRPRALRPQCG